MRIGENPQKTNTSELKKKHHRIVMVFFIPEIKKEGNESYYLNLGKILDLSLSSLIDTINLETTNITLINNASSNTIDSIVNKHVKHIDKYVIYNENKGKVNAVINEARAVYEDFLTITDSDILFYPGWEKASIALFRDFKKVGAVSPYPFPYSPFYVNKSTFGCNSLKGNIKYGKYIEDKEINLYVKGTSLPNIINRGDGFLNWRDKHFILKNNSKIAVVGSFHVVGTYRSKLFRDEYNFPNVVFKNHYEEKFIDCLADRKGYIKLSTLATYIYHIGNEMDDVSKNWNKGNSNKDMIERSHFNDLNIEEDNTKFSILLNRVIGHLFIKYIWRKLK
ncbi:glycosyltransferase family A protein [Olleya namhaensis]|uniref:glycosyltransferase family A protein n=1 Tax=Olleya namhaensis TaxID=1144750 RepID=UPI0024939F06|nr:glycosyltransferase family A protein [Olleya namhaensis]